MDEFDAIWLWLEDCAEKFGDVADWGVELVG